MTEPSWMDKDPAALIAEFHDVSGVKPGNVTYEDGMIVFRYPRTGMRTDYLTRARLQELIDRARAVQGARP